MGRGRMLPAFARVAAGLCLPVVWHGPARCEAGWRCDCPPLAIGCKYGGLHAWQENILRTPYSLGCQRR